MTLFAIWFGAGLFLAYDAITAPTRMVRARRRVARLRALLDGAGLAEMTGGQFAAACVTSAIGCGLAAALVAGTPVVAVVAMLAGGWAPVAHLRARRRRRVREVTAAWPDAVDLLAAAARAGETLPGALATVAERGPAVLRPAFRAVVTDHRIGGDLGRALDRLAADAAHPVADRVVVTLQVAHRVGGRELVQVLRALSRCLRDELTARAEIEARQSWTVVSARVAAAAPWLVLALVVTRPQSVRAFNTPVGVAVVLGGAAATVLGYRLMLAVGRIADEPRVLHPGASP
jgi:tight adherence protein B